MIIPGRDANRILGFSSPAGIALMESAEFLSGDGTFEVTKSTKFAQMWIIMTKLDKSAIPVAFAFYLLTQQGADRLQVDDPELAQGLQQHSPQLLVA